MKSDKRRACCRYVYGAADDNGTEALYVYLPITDGYIQYAFVHSVVPHKQCDVWRMGPAYLCDTELNRKTRLTREGAEWEMAIRLTDRPDFIGGVAHGDEVGEPIVCRIDGRECAVETLTAPTPFDVLSLIVDSVGYDPSAPQRAVLRHHKHFVIDSAVIRVSQQVLWLEEVSLGRSYMAMMPPLKAVTNEYRIGDAPYQAITQRSMTRSGRFSMLSLRGELGLTFRMSVEHYLTDEGKNTCSITDNGGDAYHKMYFVLAHNGHGNAGEMWETETEYRILSEMAETESS